MLQWNVFYHNFNSKKIETYNIFKHFNFRKDVEEHLKKCKTKEEFAEEMKISLMYYFWAKAEWEVVMTSWVPHIDMKELDRLNSEREKEIEKYNKEPYMLEVRPDVYEKIDVYQQVMNNFDIFVDYVWGFKK